jgi:general secretion pathway protein B
MSYILDALRKADSERERGSVPTLHSHAEHEHPGGKPGKSGMVAGAWSARAGVALAVAGVVLLLLGAWAARWLTKEPAPVSTAATAAASAAATPAATNMTPAGPLAVPLPAPSVAPIAAATSDPAPPLTPILRAPPPAAAEPLPAAKPLAGLAPSMAAPAPAASAAGAVILKFTELPDATRKALPTIATSGAMYSDTPANRMLIVNGQLLHEGEQIAPELLLERIELKSAVLVFKGQRFRISY